MSLTPEKIRTRPDFNFAFDSGACESCPAHCCRGSSGFVYVSKSQIEAFAEHMKLKQDVFIQRFLRKVGYRFALQEVEHQKGDFACIFLEPEEGRCSVYEVRPKQCRTFPFWVHFRVYPEEIDQECPGILKGDHSHS